MFAFSGVGDFGAGTRECGEKDLMRWRQIRAHCGVDAERSTASAFCTN